MIALIPARSGSKGVTNKNIRLLDGIHLIGHSILTALKINGVREVIVSTDSEKYAEIARSYGAKTPFLRPKEISNNSSTDFEFFKHFSDNFDMLDDELILHLRPTTPIRKIEVINSAIEKIKKDKNATSLRSGHLAPETPFKWFRKDKNDYFKPLIKSLSSSDINNPRQSFEEVYVSNGYIDIIKKSHLQKGIDLHGDKMIVFETPISYQVDTIEDFEFLKYILKKNEEK
jgi:CMP-N,N'-diacetyllegionaminic acid synthase